MIISETQPPPINKFMDTWERGLDPWHEDAFPPEFRFNKNQGTRKEGWYAIDWCGNVVGWIPDGTEIEA